MEQPLERLAQLVVAVQDADFVLGTLRDGFRGGVRRSPEPGFRRSDGVAVFVWLIALHPNHASGSLSSSRAAIASSLARMGSSRSAGSELGLSFRASSPSSATCSGERCSGTIWASS